MKKKNTDNKNLGNLSIRFYHDPAGLPILLLNSDETIEAYSGFYINSVSSKLPYIGWSEKIGGEPFIKDLEEYFTRKWHFALSNTVEEERDALAALNPKALEGIRDINIS